jgi:hypothetical protein
VKKLTKIKYLLEGSGNSNNLGLAPLKAKYDKHYLETLTGEETITTDLEERKNRRAMNLGLFNEAYQRLYFVDKTVTILAVIIDANHYPTVSQFLSNFKKFLKRRKISTLGFVWQRDVGVTLYRHFHLFLATTRIDGKALMEISDLGVINEAKYRFEALKTKSGMNKYLDKKELYAAPYQKCWSRSNKFKMP